MSTEHKSRKPQSEFHSVQSQDGVYEFVWKVTNWDPWNNWGHDCVLNALELDQLEFRLYWAQGTPSGQPGPLFNAKLTVFNLRGNKSLANMEIKLVSEGKVVACASRDVFVLDDCKPRYTNFNAGCCIIHFKNESAAKSMTSHGLEMRCKVSVQSIKS